MHLARERGHVFLFPFHDLPFLSFFHFSFLENSITLKQQVKLFISSHCSHPPLLVYLACRQDNHRGWHSIRRSGPSFVGLSQFFSLSVDHSTIYQGVIWCSANWANLVIYYGLLAWWFYIFIFFCVKGPNFLIWIWEMALHQGKKKVKCHWRLTWITLER